MKAKHVALFVVGAPGVGKTSALKELLGAEYDLNESPKWTLGKDVALVGHYGKGTFDGGDTVPYDGAEDCFNYWKQNILSDKKYKLSVWDGDRFSTSKIFTALRDEGIPLRCVHFTASPENLKARRDNRGSDQNEIWMKGRETKASRFAELFNAEDDLDMFGGSGPSYDTAVITVNTDNLSIKEAGAELRKLAR